MKISCWEANVAGNAIEIYSSILKTMENHGDMIVRERYDADTALIWSVLWANRMSRNKNVWDQYRQQGKPVIVAEVGGLIRNLTWRLSINGINRSARFPIIDKFDLDRPKKLNLSLKPWHSGEYILICGQHEKSQQWEKMPPMDEYYKKTILEIRKHSDRPIVIRSHPRYREKLFFNIDEEFYKAHKVEWNIPKKIRESYDSFDLEVLLPHCHCVISHSSNSGLSAVMAGTPVIVSKESLAYDMGTDDFSKIESPPMPDREKWLLELSHKEWFKEEINDIWPRLKAAL